MPSCIGENKWAGLYITSSWTGDREWAGLYYINFIKWAVSFIERNRSLFIWSAIYMLIPRHIWGCTLLTQVIWTFANPCCMVNICNPLLHGNVYIRKPPVAWGRWYTQTPCRVGPVTYANPLSCGGSDIRKPPVAWGCWHMQTPCRVGCARQVCVSLCDLTITHIIARISFSYK